METPCPHHDHEHRNQDLTLRKLTEFFECCLKDGPRPLSDKVQQIRKSIPQSNATTETRHIPGQNFTVSTDMIVADLLFTFPQIKPLLEDLHPLGLMSPALKTTSLEMFFADQPVNLEQICSDLSQIINQNQLRS
jgi:hypothetical protein